MYPWIASNVDWNNVQPALQNATIAMFNAMPESVLKAGTSVRSGYRTNAQQAAAYQRYLSGQGGLAARPGHSKHQYGLALDIYDPSGWVHKNAAQYGLNFPLGSRDYPHMQLSVGSQDPASAALGYGPSVTTSQPDNVSSMIEQMLGQKSQSQQQGILGDLMGAIPQPAAASPPPRSNIGAETMAVGERMRQQYAQMTQQEMLRRQQYGA